MASNANQTITSEQRHGHRRQQQQSRPGGAGIAPRKIGWSREEAELSISGVPDVRVMANFDPSAFDVEEFAERLRRKAAAEAAAKEKTKELERKQRQQKEDQGGLDNPFVLTRSELRSLGQRTDVPVDDVDLVDGVPPGTATGARTAAGIASGGSGSARRRDMQDVLEWDSEYDNVILPERINETASQRFRQTANTTAMTAAAGTSSDNGAETIDDDSRYVDRPSQQRQLEQRSPNTQAQRHIPHPGKENHSSGVSGTTAAVRTAPRPTQAQRPPVAKPIVPAAERLRQLKVDDVQKCIQLIIHSAEQDNGKLWETSCRKLNWLAETWPPARDHANRASCITHIIQFMTTHSHVAEVQTTGFLVVMGLCRNHTNNHVEVDEIQGLDHIIAAMRRHHGSHVEAAYNGTQCLAVMSVPDRHDEELRKHQDLVSLIVDCMRVHLLHEGIQSAGCWALANMCCNAGINQEEVKSFGLAAILHAVNQWSTSALVQREAVKALANMYHSGANRETLLSSGALEEITDTLPNFPDSPDVISTSLISIATFASTDILRHQLCTTKLVNNIIASMHGLRDSVDVQEAGCWALANLVTCETTPILVACNVIATVHGVLYRQPFVENLQTMGCMLLYNIACSVDYRLDVVLVGAAQLAVNAIRRMARVEKVVMAAVKLLCVLSHESPPREVIPEINLAGERQLGRLSVVQSSGIEALVAAMQIYQNDLALHGLALLAMAHLSDIASSHPILAGDHVMEVVLQSSGVFRKDIMIVDRVLGIMENTLVSKQSVDVFIACGGLHIVVSLMDQYIADDAILTRAAVIMARVADADIKGSRTASSDGTEVVATSPLCSTSDAKSLCVAKAGGIWLLKKAMDTFPDVPTLQTAACQALSVIATNDMAADLIVKGDLIPAITAGMMKCSNCEMVQELGATALLQLSHTAGFTGRFYRAHGDTAIKAAHKRYPKCPMIVMLAQSVPAE